MIGFDRLKALLYLLRLCNNQCSVSSLFVQFQFSSFSFFLSFSYESLRIDRKPARDDIREFTLSSSARRLRK